MALNAATLSQLIRDNLTSRGFNLSATGKDNTNWLNLFTDAVAQAVVTHIQTDAVTSVDGEKIL